MKDNPKYQRTLHKDEGNVLGSRFEALYVVESSGFNDATKGKAWVSEPVDGPMVNAKVIHQSVGHGTYQTNLRCTAM